MVRNGILWIILVAYTGCTDRRIRISSDFDRGSIGKLEEISPCHFMGRTERWNTPVPVFSYDNQHWQRIRNVSYSEADNHRFSFTQKFNQNIVWIAYAHPYPYLKMHDYLSTIESNPFVKIQSIGRSVEGRPIQMVAITDDSITPENKTIVLIIAMQHPSEDAGGFFMEGMIDFLLSEEYLSDSIRKKYVYHIIPMVNVDGFMKGMSRYNANMQDLNQQWFKTDGQPEVDAIKSWFLSYRERHGNVDLFIDIHSHGQHNPYNAVISEDPFFMQLTELLQKYWKVDYRRNQFNKSAAAYFSHMAGIPSATLELSQSHLGDEVYLTIEDYVRFGEGTVKAIYRYYNR